MKILRPLHNLLLIVSAIFFLAAFFTLGQTLDIHIHDTMIVISFAHVFMVCAVYLSLLWLLYTFTYRFLFSPKLYKVHVIGSVILFIIIIVTSLWSNQILQYYIGKKQPDFTIISAEIGNSIAIASILLTSIQLLYPLNLMIGLLKNKKR